MNEKSKWQTVKSGYLDGAATTLDIVGYFWGKNAAKRGEQGFYVGYEFAQGSYKKLEELRDKVDGDSLLYKIPKRVGNIHGLVLNVLNVGFPQLVFVLAYCIAGRDSGGGTPEELPGRPSDPQSLEGILEPAPKTS